MKILFGVVLSLAITTISAGEADVVDVKVKQKNSGSYRFNVTVLHKDEGWNHYANKWEVISDQGTVLATRVLHHPHVNEQPFTRSMSNSKYLMVWRSYWFVPTIRNMNTAAKFSKLNWLKITFLGRTRQH